jgi:serine protease Do
VQPKIVKIYGAGGVRGLEAYQSGILISAEGHVLTMWSYVLDTDFITVVLDDGRRFQAQLAGADPRTEIAVLKIEAQALPHFELASSVEMSVGARVLAFSNLFGVATGNEPASVLHGHVAARTSLSARRGAFETPYRGSVYVLDAMTNNPGAAGGALTNQRGQLAGLLGKELRNSLDNTWLNYAIPIEDLRDAVADIQAGKVRPRLAKETDRKPLQPVTLSLLGIVLIPDVLAQTPPFVDHIAPDSPAEEAGLQPDDMILFVNDHMTRSAKELKDELTYIDRIDEVRLMVQRGQQLLEFSLFAPDE